MCIHVGLQFVLALVEANSAISALLYQESTVVLFACLGSDVSVCCHRAV